MRLYWSIFWRTFCYGAAAVLSSAAIADKLLNDFHSGFDLLLGSLIMSAIAGLISVGWAWIGTPAYDPLGKAFRQAIQVAIGVLATVVITVPGDLLKLGPVLVPGLISVALAFFFTYFASWVPTPINDRAHSTWQDFVGSRH